MVAHLCSLVSAEEQQRPAVETESARCMRRSGVDWTRSENCARLRDVLSARCVQHLDYIASRAGEWISLDDVCRKHNWTSAETYGVLSSLTKFVKRVFPNVYESDP